MPAPSVPAYAGYPDAIVYDAPSRSAKPVTHLLWGDWLYLRGETQGDFERVSARGKSGWVERSRLQLDPLLEITFVDVGQGDGCVISAPRPADGQEVRFRHVIVDAGQFDNMRRYLRWRFDLGKKVGRSPPRSQHFDAAVITHPDQDHYLGFRDLLDDENVSFGALFHNGIVERASGLGEVRRNGSTYVEPVLTQDALAALLSQPSAVGQKQYPKLLRQALESGRCDQLRALTAGEFLPGFEADQAISIEVLGPVPDDVGGDKLLRSFGSESKTKNGHSVVLRLTYGNLSILLGGDLNAPAEEHLLAHFGQGLSGDAREAELRRRLGCDIAKACHHGSADFSTRFLQAVSPLTTIISSGDNEPYAHPRADALGGIGRSSRGERPLIFSTELARSARELIKHPHVLRARYRKLFDDYEREEDPRKRAKLRAKIDKLLARDLERSIAVYGAINLRTDGDKVLMAYRLEKVSLGRRWDLYRLERDEHGALAYVSAMRGVRLDWLPERHAPAPQDWEAGAGVNP